MGIRPKADSETIILTDTHRDLVDDVTATTDEFGTVLGEGINEIAATAKSANDSAGELAGRVKALEDRAAVVKDSAGRIQSADPAEPDDVATKRYVDEAVAALPAPQTVVVEASSDVADLKRQYARWVGDVPAGWRRDSVTIIPPAGWCRVRLWTTLNTQVSVSGVGVSGDVPLAHVGLTAPAVDMVAEVTGGINVRYRADGPVTFRLEITRI